MLKNGQERSNLEIIDEVSVKEELLAKTIRLYHLLHYMVEVTPTRGWINNNYATGIAHYNTEYIIKVYKRKDDQIAN